MRRKRSFRLRRAPPVQALLYVMFRSVVVVLEFVDFDTARRIGKLSAGPARLTVT